MQRELRAAQERAGLGDMRLCRGRGGWMWISVYMPSILWSYWFHQEPGGLLEKRVTVVATSRGGVMGRSVCRLHPESLLVGGVIVRADVTLQMQADESITGPAQGLGASSKLGLRPERRMVSVLSVKVMRTGSGVRRSRFKSQGGH